MTTGDSAITAGTPNGDLLRANDWDAYVGQERLKDRLRLHIDAANQSGRMLDHVLLEAPPGYGKTTIGRIIADELGGEYLEIKCPIKPKFLAGQLREWDGGGVILLDEIHAGSKAQQEALLPLLEEGYYPLDNGQRVYVFDTCIIGATTEPDKVIQPLRDRFPIRPRFADYNDDEMGLIVSGMGERIGLPFDTEAAVALGRASGGTPRVARELVLYARDLVETGVEPTVEAILDGCERDPDGLSADHCAYLALMRELGGNGAGLKTLSMILRLPEVTLRELERLLVQKKLVTFESTGRALTSAGFAKAKQMRG